MDGPNSSNGDRLGFGIGGIRTSFEAMSFLHHLVIIGGAGKQHFKVPKRSPYDNGLSTAHTVVHAESNIQSVVLRLAQFNLAYALHPNLILTGFFQYDTQAQSIGNDLRLRWTVGPGNDLFIVWNRNWQRLTLTPNDVNIVPAKDSLTVKLRWTFRQ